VSSEVAEPERLAVKDQDPGQEVLEDVAEGEADRHRAEAQAGDDVGRGDRGEGDCGGDEQRHHPEADVGDLDHQLGQRAPHPRAAEHLPHGPVGQDDGEPGQCEQTQRDPEPRQHGDELGRDRVGAPLDDLVSLHVRPGGTALTVDTLGSRWRSCHARRQPPTAPG
jgi:hypothetical protein